jgi:hypothetical protein
MNSDIKLATLVLLRLKDEDLSKLSDQELLDKFNQTSKALKELINRQVPSEPTISFK